MALHTPKGNKLDIVFKNVREDSSVHEKVIAFWKELQALPPQVDPNERAKQLLFVAENNDEVIAVTTTHRIHVKSLNNRPFFNFRVLIHPSFRIPGLVDKLCVLSRDFLESLWLEKQTDCIGMITLAENKHLQLHRNEAVWPSSGFTFIGFSKSGSPIRILYFKGAQV